MGITKLFALAWRNLWRQRRRTLLTLVSIAFGGFLAVLMTAMQDRSFADFIDTAAKLGSGHVTLQHPEYLDTPTLTRTVKGVDEKMAVAEGVEDVVHVVDRTSGQTMLSTAHDSYGAFFIAYDPALETDDTFEFDDGLVKGELFQDASDDGIVLGTILARNLGAGIGDKVVFTLTDRTGEIVTGMERLRGTVDAGSPALNAGLCLLPLDTVREVIGYDPTEGTQVAVFLSDGRQSNAVRAALDAKLGDDVAVLTWDQIQPEIQAFIAMKVGGGRFMEIIIGLLVAAGIFNTLFMSVMERGREFGIMLAIGYSSAQLFALVMFESLLLAGMGLVAAIALTAGPYYYLYNHGIDLTEAYTEQGLDSMDVGGVGFDMILRIGIFPENAIAIAVAIVLATVFAGLYPAWRAGRVDPVTAINLS